MKNILFIGAHPDDIEIHAGGIISKLNNKCSLYGLILTHANTFRSKETLKGMKKLSMFFVQKDYPDMHLHEHNQKIIDEILNICSLYNIDTIFTHNYDTHSDHISVYQATQSAVRKKNFNVFLYQPTYPSNNNKFIGNYVVKLTETEVNNKLKAINCHKSQIKKYSKDNITYVDMLKIIMKSNAIIYGNLLNSYAEVFEIYKLFN